MKKNYLLKQGLFFGKLGLIFISLAIVLTIVFLFISGEVLNLLVADSPKASWEDVYRPRAEVAFLKQTSPILSAVPNGTLPKAQDVKDKDNIGIGTKIIIPLDFTTQAPLGVWDALHEETCEEADLAMIYAWTKHLQLTPELAEKEMLKLVDWQKSNLGYFENTSAEDTAKIAKSVYNLESRKINNPSIEDIKKEISNGNLVLVGMAGKLLNNPFFKAPGPVYHMLLFRGFDEKGFFTNDPGTRRGNNFYYTYQNITEAAHDWNGSEESLLDSPPVALVFSRSN